MAADVLFWSIVFTVLLAGGVVVVGVSERLER